MKNYILKKTAIIIAVFLFCTAAFAQPDKLGSWNVANLMYKPNEHLVVYAELQARAQRPVQDFYYHEVKAGIGYNLPKKLSVLFAAGDYRTYAYPGNFKDLQTKEFRMWEQFIINSNIGRIRVEHRYRVEQRWVNSQYKNRFRYRLNPIIPINGKTLAPHVFYVTINDEVFFTNKAPYFERNRFFAGAGYLFSSIFTLQTGFIRQYDYRKSDDGVGKNYIQTTLFFSIDESLVPHENKHPSTMD